MSVRGQLGACVLGALRRGCALGDARPFAGLALVMLTAGTATAQTYTTSSQFSWDAPANAMDAADAQAFTYRAFVNGASVGVVLASVTCGPPVAPDVTFSCAAPFPAEILPGMNRRRSSVYLTAEDTVTPVSGESDASNIVVTNRRPGGPTKLRGQ